MFIFVRDLMLSLVGTLLSVLGFTSVVDKNGIDSMHHVFNMHVSSENRPTAKIQNVLFFTYARDWWHTM